LGSPCCFLSLCCSRGPEVSEWISFLRWRLLFPITHEAKTGRTHNTKLSARSFRRLAPTNSPFHVSWKSRPISDAVVKTQFLANINLSFSIQNIQTSASRPHTLWKQIHTQSTSKSLQNRPRRGNRLVRIIRLPQRASAVADLLRRNLIRRIFHTR
jgi:hypothetical protein